MGRKWDGEDIATEVIFLFYTWLYRRCHFFHRERNMLHSFNATYAKPQLVLELRQCVASHDANASIALSRA